MDRNLGRLLNCRHHCAGDLPRRRDRAARPQHYCEELELVLNVLLAWPAIRFPRDDGGARLGLTSARGPDRQSQSA